MEDKNKTVKKQTAVGDPRNVMVKAKRKHGNQHGETYIKAKDSSYLHPAPAADIAAGNVELAESAKD